MKNNTFGTQSKKQIKINIYDYNEDIQNTNKIFQHVFDMLIDKTKKRC